MKIVMDRNIRAAGRVFEHHGDVIRLDGRAIGPADVRDADALIVRSVTQVNVNLLAESRVRFVGTTTIGTDHLDTDELERAGITWVSAPGCNADGAAQYTLAMIWLACQRTGKDPTALNYGIIGLGNVGSRLKKLLQATGAAVIANDPPLSDAGYTGLHSLHEVLESDVVSLHVPLTRSGRYPTLQMMNRDRLGTLCDGSLLVNAARGDVVHGPALLEEITSGRLHAALDVWPGEPQFDPDLITATTVATPHVAGYSVDGRRNGALMVYRAFCDWAGVTAHAAEALPAAELNIDASGLANPMHSIFSRCCFVEDHDQAMRSLLGLPMAERAAAFDHMRRNYPPRRDFPAWSISGADLELATVCRNLGFSIDSTEARPS